MQMAKDAQAEMITIGLQDEGGMVDEASGNEVPNGALKEEVRDDQPAMLSPGEFVIPAYAVRYFGVEQFVKMLRAAKQGMEQLSDMGLTGEPNSDDSSLETAMLPTDVDEDISQFQVGGFQPGAVTKEALPPQQATQQVFPTSPVVAAATAPSPVTTTAAAPTVPIRAATPMYTYPQLQYNPTDSGAGTGYGVAEYVGPQGQAIFVTTIGGRPVSQIPEGYVTRAEYTKKQTTTPTTSTTPPTELQLKPEDMDPGTVGEGGISGGGDGGKAAAAMYASAVEYAYGSRSTAGTVGGAAAGFLGGGILGGILGFLGIGDKAGRAAAKAYVESEAGKYHGTKGGQLEGGKNIKDLTDAQRQELAEKTAATKTFVASDKGRTGSITQFANEQANDQDNAFAAGKAIDAAISIYGEDSDEAAAVATNNAAQYGITVGDGGTGGTGGTSGGATSGGAQGIPASISTPPDASGMGSEPGGVEYSAPSDAPSDMDAANVSMPNKGGFIGMAEGGLIKVGDKTYGPEDFGFANKGTFVTKKKTRKRKPRGKGLASSM